jgi:hypothetical protein
MTRASVSRPLSDEEPVIAMLNPPQDTAPEVAPYRPSLADVLIDWTGGCANCRCETLLARYPGAAIAVAAEVGRGRVVVAVRCRNGVTIRAYRSVNRRGRLTGPPTEPAPHRLVAVARRIYRLWSGMLADSPGSIG